MIRVHFPGARTVGLIAGTGWPWRCPFKPGSPGAFVAAALVVLVGLLARGLIARDDPAFPQFMFLFPAIMMSGWFCGAAAGAMAIAISAGAADFLWPSLRPNPILLPGVDALTDAIFIAVAGLILSTTVALRRALAQAERTRTMLDSALGKGDVGTWEVDLARLTVRASRGTHELHGVPFDRRTRPVEQWLGNVDGEDAARLRQMISDAAHSGRQVSLEYRVRDRDGSERTIVLRGGVVTADGKRLLVGALIDVTDRVRAEALVRMHEERLRDRDAKFRALAEAIPGILYVTDATGKNTYTNRYFLDFAGVGLEDLRGEGWTRCVHPDDLDGALAGWSAALAESRPFRSEYRLRARDGSYRWFLFHAVPAYDAESRIAEWYGVGIEIEDRKRAEAALADNEKRLRLAIEAGCLGTFEVDLGTRRRYWDPRLAAMFGLNPQPSEIEPAKIPHFADPDDLRRIEDHFEEAVATGRLGEIEFRIVTPAGEIRWVASSGLVLRGHDGEPDRMIGAMRDVTEQRRREDALREALEAREVLVREADHRIKNSLQLVVGLLTLQRSRVSDPEASEALASAAARVEAIAQSHLALQHSVDFKTFDLGRALQELCARLGPLTPGVQLECRCERAFALDAERAIPLALIVSELLTNAIRHAYPGGEGIVTVDVAREPGRVSVIVTDAGVGYQQSHIKPGLGSTVVQNLARQIGADVAIRTSPGSGTSTTVTLPL